LEHVVLSPSNNSSKPWKGSESTDRSHGNQRNHLRPFQLTAERQDAALFMPVQQQQQQPFYGPFVRDSLGEPVPPEETFIQSLSASSIYHDP